MPPDADALLILSPLRAEIEEALQGLGAGAPVPAPSPAALSRYEVRGRPVVAGWSGIGGEATRRAVAALDGTSFAAVLHLGVAGALRASLRSGDALLCERVFRDGPEGGDPRACAAHGDLGARLRDSVDAVAGSAVSVEQVVGTPEGKRALARRHPDAAVVEMETWWAADAAEALGAPVTCLRVVCDRLDESVPDLSSVLDPVGQPRRLALARHLARHPAKAAALPRVARAFQRARARLTQAVEAAVEA